MWIKEPIVFSDIQQGKLNGYIFYGKEEKNIMKGFDLIYGGQKGPNIMKF